MKPGLAISFLAAALFVSLLPQVGLAAEFKSDKNGFSFNYPESLTLLDEKQTEKFFATLGRGNMGFTMGDVKEGRVFIFAGTGFEKDIWSARSLVLTLEPERPVVDESYVESRRGEEVRQWSKLLQGYKSLQSNVAAVDKVNSFFMHAAGRYEVISSDPLAPTSYIEVEQFIYVIPLQNGALRLVFSCTASDANLMRSTAVNLAISTMRLKQEEKPPNIFEDKKNNFKFEYPADWTLLNETETNALLDKFGAKFLKFSRDDVRNGLAFVILDRENPDAAWSAGSIVITIEAECPVVDTEFARMRSEQEANQAERFFTQNYSVREASVIKINNVDCFFMRASGILPGGTAEQFIYLIPLGEKSVRLAFTANTAESREMELNVVSAVVGTFQGAKLKEVSQWGTVVVIAAALVVLGLSGVGIWLSRRKIQNIRAALSRRTYKHEGITGLKRPERPMPKKENPPS